MLVKKGKEWWIRNGLPGFPVTKLKSIKGDHNEYIRWLKDKFYNYTYDENGNILTYKKFRWFFRSIYL